MLNSSSFSRTFTMVIVGTMFFLGAATLGFTQTQTTPAPNDPEMYIIALNAIRAIDAKIGQETALTQRHIQHKSFLAQLQVSDTDFQILLTEAQEFRSLSFPTAGHSLSPQTRAAYRDTVINKVTHNISSKGWSSFLAFAMGPIRQSTIVMTR